MQTIVVLLALLCAVVIAAICCNVFSKRASRAHSYIYNNVVMDNFGVRRGSYLANDGCLRAGACYNDESKSDYVQAGELIERLGKMSGTRYEMLRDYLKKSMDFICGTTSFITKDEFMSSAHEVFNKSWLKGHDEMDSIIITQ